MKSRRGHPLQKYLEESGIRRLKLGHPWLRKNDIKASWLSAHFNEAFGTIHLGEHWFLFESASFLPLRRLGPSTRFWNIGSDSVFPGPPLNSEESWNLFAPWLAEHLRTLVERKKNLVDHDSCFRWVFADADLIPGLAADVYENVLILESSHPLWTSLKTQLEKIFLECAPAAGLKINAVYWQGEAPAKSQIIFWNSFKWIASPGATQKTGMYLDQRVNHQKLADWARRLQLKTAWDICAFQGGFSLHLAKLGCEVVAVDSSETALEVLRENAKLNGLGQRIQTQKADAFEWLRQKADKKEKSHLIILDPPSLGKTKASQEGALRGLKELNLRALMCLQEGGLMFSCVCSHHIFLQDVLNVAREAAHNVRKELRILDYAAAAPDHSPLSQLPESDYLKGVIFQVQ